MISAGSFASQAHLGIAEEMLSPVGKVLRLPEYQQDAATALAGSGPAYVYYLIEAMADAGVLVGMPRQTALELVTQAVYGAAAMVRDSGEHPVILREAVTSPGGTTIAAIRELESHGVRGAIFAVFAPSENERWEPLPRDDDVVEFELAAEVPHRDAAATAASDWSATKRNITTSR